MLVDPRYLTWCRGLGPEAEALQKPEDAAQRLTTGSYLVVSHGPKFRIDPAEKFFCMGSCFAINVSRALIKQGVDVLSWNFDHPRGMALLSQFNTYSMLNEVEEALLGKVSSGPEAGLVELSEGRWWDPQLHHGEISSREDALALRKHVNAYFARLANADTCIITLGLTEMFWDTVTDLPLNGGPVDWKHALRTKRFEFRNPGFSVISQNVNRLCEMVRNVTGGRAKIILTVSPVPLQRTFAEKDIIVASNYSKACLRTAAEEAARAYDFVDYFPAYEMVTYSPREIVWERDQRHVTNAMVDHVISTFRAAYMDVPSGGAS